MYATVYESRKYLTSYVPSHVDIQGNEFAIIKVASHATAYTFLMLFYWAISLAGIMIFTPDSNRVFRNCWQAHIGLIEDCRGAKLDSIGPLILGN